MFASLRTKKIAMTLQHFVLRNLQKLLTEIHHEMRPIVSKFIKHNVI